jgi:DNA-binding GntR family transcriptional regulator
VFEIYGLRDGLERFAVELAFPDPNPEGIRTMQRAIAEMRHAADAGDHAGVVLANRHFHVALVGLGGNSRLGMTYEALMDQMQLCMSANLRQEVSASGDYQVGLQRHERLMASVEGGNQAEILAAMAEHGSRNFLAAAVPAILPDGE